METKELLTLQEIEQLCRAYTECRLSRLRERELELVLLCSDFSSPVIDEVRALMGLTAMMSLSRNGTYKEKNVKSRAFRIQCIAACITIIMICSGYFYWMSAPTEEVTGVYVCSDGKVLSGYAAQAVVSETEIETMDMYRSAIEDAEAEQRFSELYMNSIIE